MNQDTKHFLALHKLQQSRQQTEFIKAMLGTNNDPFVKMIELIQERDNFKLTTQIMEIQQQKEQEFLKQHLVKNNNLPQTYGQQNQTQKKFVNNFQERNNRNQQNVNVQVNVETLKCPLSGDFFFEAFTINSCGHNFEKSLIEKWLSSNNSCPVCRKAANKHNITKNYALQEIVNDYKKQN